MVRNDIVTQGWYFYNSMDTTESSNQLNTHVTKTLIERGKTITTLIEYRNENHVPKIL